MWTETERDGMSFLVAHGEGVWRGFGLGPRHGTAGDDDACGTIDCSEGTPCTTGVGSPLTQGSSGGPWVYLSDDGYHYANGLNSYSYTNCNYNMFSPYFDSKIWDLYQEAKNLQ